MKGLCNECGQYKKLMKDTDLCFWCDRKEKKISENQKTKQ